MKRFARIIWTLVGITTVGLAIDYVKVARKERLLSNAVSKCGGRMGSIPLWPLGTEYRITLSSVPSRSQLCALAIANQMRGWVGIAFNECEINQEDSERLLLALPKCHLFVIKDGKMIPMANASAEAEEPSHAPVHRFAESGALTTEASPRRPADA